MVPSIFCLCLVALSSCSHSQTLVLSAIPFVSIAQSAQVRAKGFLCGHSLVLISVSLAAQHHTWLAISHTTTLVTAHHTQARKTEAFFTAQQNTHNTHSGTPFPFYTSMGTWSHDQLLTPIHKTLLASTPHYPTSTWCMRDGILYNHFAKLLRNCSK